MQVDLRVGHAVRFAAPPHCNCAAACNCRLQTAARVRMLLRLFLGKASAHQGLDAPGG